MGRKTKKTTARRKKGQETLPSFPSESKLQQDIARLLERIPEISGVQIIQGAQEFGKDIVFNMRGPLGEPLACACVVKNSRITGSVDSNSGARTVFIQVEQGLDTPFLDSAGSQITIARVYVMSPAPLAQSTLMAIRGKLKARSGQVQFFCGRALFALFRKYWPDYCADDAVGIEHHLRSLAKHLDEASAISAVAYEYGLGELTTSETRIYVEPSFYRELEKYTFLHPLDLLVLGKKDLRDTWMPDSFRNLKKWHRLLVMFTEHCESWGFLQPTLECRNADGVRRLLGNLAQALYASWLSQLRKTLKLAVLNRGDIEEGSTSKLSDTRGIKRLEAITSKVAEQVASLIAPVYERMKFSVPARASIKAKSCVLSTEEFHRNSNTCDFFHGVHESMLRRPRRIRYEFTKKLLSEYESSLLVVGGPGSGKTAFCRWNALRDMEEFSAGGSQRVPVYVPLHRVPTNTKGQFVDVFLTQFGQSSLLDNAKLKLSCSQRIRLYLDGLDEVRNTQWRQHLVELARAGTKQYSRVQVIITARDYVFAPWLAWLPRVSIGALDDREIRELAEQWFDSKSEAVDAFFCDLRKSAGLMSLMRVPLLATLVILVYRRKKQLPRNRAHLFKMFVDLLSGGWDLAKDVLRASRFSAEIKVMVLSSLASDLHAKGVRQFRARDLVRAVKRTIRRLGDASDELLAELIIDGLLVQEAKSLQFRHHSFQEFFAARDLLHAVKPTRVKKAITEFLCGNDWWNEVTRFYVELAENPRELVRWLHDDHELQRYFGDSNHRFNELLRLVVEAYPEFDIVDEIGYDPQGRYDPRD